MNRGVPGLCGTISEPASIGLALTAGGLAATATDVAVRATKAMVAGAEIPDPQLQAGVLAWGCIVMALAGFAGAHMAAEDESDYMVTQMINRRVTKLQARTNVIVAQCRVFGKSLAYTALPLALFATVQDRHNEHRPLPYVMADMVGFKPQTLGGGQ